MMFATLYVFNPTMAPFARRSYVLDWFRREFHASTPKHDVEFVKIWKAFLTPKLLSSRLGNTKDTIGVVRYQPNLVLANFCPFPITIDHNRVLKEDTHRKTEHRCREL